MRATALILALAVSLLGGCALYPRVEITEPTAPEPQQPVAVTVPVTGGIYQAVLYRPLFEDYRARIPGDTLVVQIVEKVSASQKSTSSVDKGGSLSGSVSAIPFLNPAKLAKANASVGATGQNTFAGKGATENSNDFSGTITVTVRSVLPNGHLVVAGEKQIGVNANVDVLRFAGQVDPRSINPGNTVTSGQIANVRLEHRGRGQQADAQAMGWLQRVFLSVVSPL